MALYKIDNKPAAITFETKGLIERTVQNAKNLLMTHMGEVPYDRYRGFDPVCCDLPLPELKEALLAELDRVMLWEPDVSVQSADCTLDDDGNVVIEAALEINLTD
ncbi:MAG: hypothetical protein LLF96_07455 [Eubacteriales bacterium]|nr:hypothetical protein [Eubacteriales bacterium]